jgi:hypothetical protein
MREGAGTVRGEARKAFVEAAVQAGGALGPEPDAADLALINQRFALAPLAPEEVYVRRMVLANDALDRSFERFTPAVLERFAQTLPGKPVLVAHDKRALPIGLVYRAQVRPARPGEAGDVSLEAALYMVKSPENAAVRQQIDGGVVRYVSVGFRYDTRICSVCDQDYADCPHVPGEEIDGARGRRGDGATGRRGDGGTVYYTYGGDLSRYEACECSLVYLGCQQMTQLVKGSGGGGQGSEMAMAPGSALTGGNDMENEKALARITELEGEVRRLAEALKAADGETGGRDQGGTGRAGASVPSVAPSPPLPVSSAPPVADEAALAADGKAYRQHLKEEVKRLAGILKSEAEANLLLKALPHAPAEALKELLESYQRKVEEKFPPRGLAEMAAAEVADDRRPATGATGPARPVRFS